MTDYQIRRRAPPWSRLEPMLLGVAAPLAATAVGLPLTSIILLKLLGANPIESFQALVDGALGNKNSIADTLVKATPLLFVGVGHPARRLPCRGDQHRRGGQVHPRCARRDSRDAPRR
ncbi:MAG: hypothetical protein WKF58_11770 [Ilumatobacteraceae bacterium]